MSVFLVHTCWFILFLLLSSFFLLVSICVSLWGLSVSISLDLFSSWFMNLSVSISLDLFSSWFSFVVSFISSIIMIYSFFYMAPYSKVNYFLWLTILFVVSMLIVINMTNFFFVMLGWDGLGLVSFLLIVYYQNYSSVYSGLFTVLMNRVGDCFFIISISLMAFFSPTFWDLNNLTSATIILSWFMLLTFMTKSAIYPFSPWLPMAMAAPTPISALVHSSTLVTAGLYLSMRFSYLFYSNPNMMTFMLILSVFTSFYAGMNAVFEMDMKKLIALSTLSHLGFIGMAFSCGLLYLSFFHLLVHALFKSALFMAMGDIMTNMFHSQDIRFLSSGLKITPMSFYIMMVSILNLLGIPSISGFFSKDLVLETLNFSFSSVGVVSLVFFNLLFTYYYSYKLFYFTFSSMKLSPYSLLHASSLFHIICLTVISFVGIFFGMVWLNYLTIWSIHVTVPFFIKITPYFLNLLVFMSLFVFLKSLSLNSQNLSFFFSNMMFLSNLMMSLTSRLFLSVSFMSCKSLEFGSLNMLINNSIPLSLSSLSLLIYKSLSLNSLYFLFIFSLFSYFLFIFLLSNMTHYLQLLLALSF